MPYRLVEEISVNGVDPAGNKVVCIYAKKPPEYLVYSDPTRVMVHFADNDRVARRQRAALALLNPVRGQISGLVDGWRISKDLGLCARAVRYDRRVADAMIMGLEGGVTDALTLLTDIRNDILAERQSMAQTDYLMVAAAAAIGMLILILLLSRPSVLPLAASPEDLATIWTAASGGVLGAFFSVAIGLRSRSIFINLQQWDNRRDSILRIAVGTIGGAILICLFLTDLFSLANIKFGGTNSETAGSGLITALMLGFLAGFSERAVPDLLARTNLAGGEYALSDSALSNAAAAKSAAAATATTSAAQGSALGLVDDDQDLGMEVITCEDDELDQCLCDSPPEKDEELTTDIELPAASGGVSAEAPPAPAPEEDVNDIRDKAA